MLSPSILIGLLLLAGPSSAPSSPAGAYDVQVVNGTGHEVRIEYCGASTCVEVDRNVLPGAARSFSVPREEGSGGVVVVAWDGDRRVAQRRVDVQENVRVHAVLEPRRG
jgi:hypothetical protein